ncbi:MAG: efflux RND transporter periplasmic adaptor subunit [Flavobacteriaceae bacterium]
MKQHFQIVHMLIWALSIGSCGHSKKQGLPVEEKPSSHGMVVTKEQFEANGMTLRPMEEKEMGTGFTVSGMIDVPPENRAVANTPVGGYVKHTPLLVGDRVQKGQRLVVLENPDFVAIQQEYLETKERLGYLKSEYERQKILLEEKITSQKNFLKAESDYKSALARYTGLKKQLELLHIGTDNADMGKFTSLAPIYAPITGTVSKVYVTMGSYVSPVTPILELVDNGHLHLELAVYEKDIMKVKKGQNIRFRIPEASNEIFEAKVHLIGNTIDENRTINVHGHIENERDHAFLTGMFVEAEIILGETEAFALPMEAFVKKGDTTYFALLQTETGEDGFHFEPIEFHNVKEIEGWGFVPTVPDSLKGRSFLVDGAFALLGSGSGHAH